MSQRLSLAQITEQIGRHPDGLRVKKLLIYTTENRWESDGYQLAHCDLGQIVLKLQRQCPTLLHLRQALHNAVNTLSRPQAYGQLADFIVQTLAPLYEQSESSVHDEATRIVAVPRPLSAPQGFRNPLEQVAYRLENHREGIRIKKLLFALYYQQWENDFQVLGQYSFVQLLRELKGQYVSPSAFAASLQQLVSCLNRQEMYQELASYLLESSQILFQGADEQTGLTRPTFPPIAVASPEVPNPFGYQGLMALGQPSPQARESYLTEVDLSPMERDVTLNGLAEVEITEPADTTGITEAIAANEVTQSKHFLDRLDIYQLKLEIMKYANPLRVKILLFSAAHHPFDLSGQDWSMLRTCDFDDLLRDTVREAATPVALEIRLSAIAQSLFEPEEHLQATSAIIQSINLLSQAQNIS